MSEERSREEDDDVFYKKRKYKEGPGAGDTSLKGRLKKSYYRNKDHKAKPAEGNERAIFHLQQTANYGYGNQKTKKYSYGDLQGEYRRGFPPSAPQPFETSAGNYDKIIADFGRSGVEDKAIADVILRAIYQGPDALDELPEGIQRPAWNLINLTQIIDSHSTRNPGAADKMARTLFDLIARGETTFKKSFNRKDGLFFSALARAAAAPVGGQQAMRIFLGKPPKKSDKPFTLDTEAFEEFEDQIRDYLSVSSEGEDEPQHSPKRLRYKGNSWFKPSGSSANNSAARR
jgi:hypothetical protein